MTDEELSALLESIREKNKKAGITGMLLYKGGNFLQLLEGERDAVEALFQKIKRTPGIKTSSLLWKIKRKSRHLNPHRWDLRIRNNLDNSKEETYE